MSQTVFSDDEVGRSLKLIFKITNVFKPIKHIMDNYLS